MELQLFVVWNSGCKYYSNIIQNLSSVFRIRSVYKTEWDKSTTVNKMIKLYEFSLEEAEEKVLECGYGQIFIIITEDLHPATKLHLTKYGIIPVSRNALEIKEKIRNSYQNRNIIHGTMLDFEFNNDIKICLNKTKEEFTSGLLSEWSGEICKI